MVKFSRIITDKELGRKRKSRLFRKSLKIIMGKRIFIKFGEKAHLQSIIDGTIRFAPAGNYIFMEEKLHKRGQGDCLEGKFIVNYEGYCITSPHIKKKEDDKGKIKINFPNINNMLVFCLTEYDEKYISNEGLLKIPNNELDNIKKDFPKATHALVILDDEKFIKAIENADNHKIISDKIHYFNLNVLNIRMINFLLTGRESTSLENQLCMTYENRYRHLLCKDEAFSNQNEYRFIVLDELSDLPKFYSFNYKGRYKLIKIDELRKQMDIS